MPLSLQCPRCNGAVSVADQAAGKRVKCPHCEQNFLAPGIASSSNDDDDWLSLDETPQAPAASDPPAVADSTGKTAPKQPAQGPGAAKPISIPGTGKPNVPTSKTPTSNAPKPQGGVPVLSSDEEALLAEFTSDLDEFTAEIEAPPPPHPSAPASAATPPGNVPPFRGLPPGAAPTPAKPKPKPATDVVEYAKEYRVACNICGSFLYAKAAQAGKTVKCSDCYSPVTIPPPPKIKKKNEIDLDQAETFALEQSKSVERGPDPYQKSARQLLDDASREEHVNPSPAFDDTPSVKEWLKNVFGIFKDLGVIAHWIGLSVLASVPTVIALQLDVPILILGLFIGGFFLGVLTVSCGFAILYSVANQEESVTDWPTFDPMAWLGQLCVVIIAASFVAVPLYVICAIILGPSLISAAITMFSIYIFFPFVLLSMLDMNSPLVPFSAEVARSVTKCEEAWGGFYFSAGLLFVALFLIFATSTSSSDTVGAVVSITAGIGATFIYFSMLGRLAYAIGQAVNAPARKQDIDQSGDAA